MAPARPDLRIEALAPHHDRDGFASGVESLDRYLRSRAGQDVRRRTNGVFVLTEVEAPAVVLGFYTLCASALPSGEIPEAVRRHLPRYPLVSTTLVGRLAVARHRQGEGLGAIILADAVRRAHASAATVGSSMLMVDALDERAAAFYAANGFLPLPDSARMILPMLTIRRMLEP